MPIYVAHAGYRGGITLESLDIARDAYKVWERTQHALSRGIMRLSVLDDDNRTYQLPSDAPFPGAFLDTKYSVKPIRVHGSLLPESARVTIPGHAVMNEYPCPYPVHIELPADGVDGSHIVPIVSRGRDQGHELMEPGAMDGPYQRPFPAAGFVLRGAILHDMRFFDGVEPFRGI